MRVVLRLAVLVVVLSGCTRVLDIAGVDWRRPNTPIQQETFDEVECVRDTEGAGDLVDTVVGGVADMIVVPLEDRRRGQAYDRCMIAKGYTPVAAPQR
jgi:hypothetical protein